MADKPANGFAEKDPAPLPSDKAPKQTRPIIRIFGTILGLLTTLVLVGVFFHAQILGFISSQLVREDPLPKGQYAVLLFGCPQWSQGYEHVIRILPAGEPVVLMKGKQTRLMRLGLEGPWWQTDIDQLKKKGVGQFEFLEDPSAHYSYQYVPLMAKWLDDNPKKSLCVCHSRFDGSTLARTLARHLTPQQLKRVALIPVNQPDFDAALWWQKKEGQGSIIGAYSNLIFDLFFGDGEAPGPDWDPKAYEESLR